MEKKLTEQEKTFYHDITLFEIIEELRRRKMAIYNNIPESVDRDNVIKGLAHLERATSELWNSMGYFVHTQHEIIDIEPIEREDLQKIREALKTE